MPDQEFEYNTPENIDANLFVKTGYTFAGWNTKADGTGLPYIDGAEVTNLATSGTVNLYAEWTPNTNTAYKVIHKKQKVTLDGYDEIVENLTGTSDTSVTPTVNNYTGFTTPTAQTVTISRLGDTVVTYVYDREIYTISFNTDGGSTVADQSVAYGAKVAKPADPTKTNYTFDDWYTNSNYQTPFDFDEPVTGPTTIYGKFDINTYTVTFNTDGGSTEPAQVIAHGGTVTRPSTDPTKTGYNFINWYADSNYQTLFDFTNTTITGPTTIYAKFEIKTFTVSFDTDGGSSVPSQTINYGGTVTRPSTDPTKTGHTFDDWYTDNNYQTLFDFTNITITDTTTIYGKFDINTYTITFNTDGGSTEPAQVIAHGGTVTRPSTDPTKTGYNFINWYADSNYQTLFDFTNTTITGPTTIYAKFEIKTFTVSFDTDGGSSVPSQTINYGGTVTRPSTDPTKTGHTFDDWYTDSNYQTPFDFTNTTITNTTTIYGKFISQSVTVTFDVDGGESVNPITITRGQSISTLPTTTKEDYRFEGWYLDLSDPTPVSEPFTPTTDVELKAKWQKMICKKATTLTSVECHSNSNKGCRKAGYLDGDIVTFGNIVSSDTYASGDALLCDVDGTGYNKRFYYMRTLNGNAVLIHDQILVLENDAAGTNYIYNTAKTILPDVTTWTTLPVKFENDTKAARFPTIEDTKAAAGRDDVTSNNSLSSGVSYLFENVGTYVTTSGNDTVWLNEVINGGTTYRYRYHDNNLSVVQVGSGLEETSKNCVKPVIEVPLDLIEDDYVVGFNPRGGTVTTGYIRVKKGNAIGTLPTTTKSGYIFDGWYTSSQYTTSIDENTVPNDYDIYYAKWILDISNAVIPNVSFAFSVGDEDDIEITSLDVEPVTYTSNDDTVVTVDSNGHIVAIDEGTTTITITGTRTGHVRTINIRVEMVLSNCVVSFDTLGGSSVGNMTVPANTALGSLPSPDPTLTDYVFGGWYTDTTYTTEVTINTVIRGDTTFYAKWIPADAVAELNNNQFYTTIQDAIHNAPASGQSTIKVLQDVTVTSGMVVNMYTTDVDKDIILDLNNHTIKATTNYAVRSKGNLIIKDGTVQCTTGKGAIESNTGTLVLDNVRVEASGNRQALYIENKPTESGSVTSTLGPPEVEIRGNSYLQAKAQSPRGTVQLVSGTLRITSGTIVATTAPALYVTGGTAIVGTQDGAYDNTTPVLKGNTYGIDGTAAIYDGIIMGKTAAVKDETLISGTETGSVKVNDNDGTYYILYYQMP